MTVLLTTMLLLALDAAVAFLSLDLIFRSISVEPSGLKVRLTRWRLFYVVLASIFAALHSWAGFHLGGTLALGAAPFYLLPWWLLWRFGLRKQFTFLFEPAERTKEPVS